MMYFPSGENLLSKALLAGLVFFTLVTTTANAASDKAAIESAVAAFQTIGTLRKQSPIDGDAIATAYAGALQTLTQEVDEDSGLALDSSVSAAIDEIQAGNEAFLAAQVIDKSLQHAFFQTILNRITSVRDNFDTSSSIALTQQWEEAIAAFQAIKGTAARENRVISADRQSIEAGTNPALDVAISESFTRGQTALGKTNPAEDKITVAIERQIIRISLARAYYIGVLREVTGILSNLEEIDEAREAQKEGEIFYRIIESFVSRDNPLGNKLIKAQLTGDVANVNADQMVSELNKGFIGRVKSELTANESSVGSDRGRAMEVAEEALLYANVFLADLEIRMGVEKKNEIETALNTLKTASNAGNTTSATDARQTISAILDDYEDVLELAVYAKNSDTGLIIDGAVAAFKEIGVLRKQFPIDSAAIAAQYEGDLQDLTKIIDSIYGTTIDADILAAIQVLENDSLSLLAAQVIDKSLQRVFALTVYNRITLVNDLYDELTTDEMTLEWDRAYAAYQAISGTAGRENKVLTDDKLTIKSGSNPDIDDQVTLAFIQGRQALEKENENDSMQVALARERIVIPLVRSFLIGVLREVEGIIKDRDADVAAAREKQVEGEYFYRIVEGFISQDNPSGSNNIKAQMIGDLNAVVADQVVSEISRGIIGQMSRHLMQAEMLISSATNEALLAAERVALYADILLPDLELRIGSLQRAQLENALQDLIESIRTDDADKAFTAKSAITSVVTAYHAELY